MCGNATEENTSPSTLRMEAELNAETLVTSVYYRVIFQETAV
jgi:hypothetical protein